MNKKRLPILKGFFHEFSPLSYPGRIYGMYTWNSKKHCWERDEVYCKKYDL
jgi:hypothetical protein